MKRSLTFDFQSIVDAKLTYKAMERSRYLKMRSQETTKNSNYPED